MSEKSNWVTPVILLGAIAIGGYFLYNWLKNKPISKALDTAGAPGLIPGVVPAVNLYTAIVNPTGTITPKNVHEISIDIGKTGQSATPGNILNDPWGFFFNAFGQLPNMISAVKMGTSSSEVSVSARSKKIVPIVTKTDTGGIKILKPLEIVAAGKSIATERTAAPKKAIPIVSKTSSGFKVLTPLEIVAAGKLIRGI